MWKLLFQSVRGTAHERGGLPCQDNCLARLRPTVSGPVLVLACSDGAGSASQSHWGSRHACEAAVRLVSADLAEGLTLRAIDRDTAVSWLKRVRHELSELAESKQIPVRDLACTLLLAVVGESSAAFAQLGDGAIVIWRDSEYHPIFWPQNGEYANTTNFITDYSTDDLLAFETMTERVDELALFSDGLQMLALSYADRTAFRPFFRPLFRPLRASRGSDGLALALKQFLNSPMMNDRSDDDKTLMLATRRNADDP